MNRGYIDDAWFSQLNDKGTCFVTCLKPKSKYRVSEWHSVRKNNATTMKSCIKITSFVACV